MRYVCLIHWNEDTLANLPQAVMKTLNVGHLEFNESLKRSGHWVEAHALMPSRETVTLRPQGGKAVVTDGPFAETKEQVAGFYLIEARDLNEAIQVAQRLPSAAYATVEVRAVRELDPEGREGRAP